MNFTRNFLMKNVILINKVFQTQASLTSPITKCGILLKVQVMQYSISSVKLNKFTETLLSAATKKTKDAVKSTRIIHDQFDNIPAALQMKKRQQRKKLLLTDDEEDLRAEGFYNVTAYATAEEYDLESLLDGLEQQDLYAPQKYFSTDNLGAEQDVLYVTAKYQVEDEPRDIFFFREGSVVLWNCNEVEINNILELLRKYERDRYRLSLVKGESETMPYTYLPEEKHGAQFRNGRFFLTKGEENFLEKYTFANALTTSIKLGVWEATLENYIDSMEFITEDLKRGTKIRINRRDLLRKTGELFALRHLINLSSDLLDTPDFYWDREELEALYLQVCNYFSISRRTKVMNEKLNHCVELAELVSSHLNDAHHIRLEWMIIILIMVEVGFEIVHYAERYYDSEQGNIEVSMPQQQ